ncbi:MAG: CBS domain-containing protein [Chloroflexota bacterium]|nr:CBS domain-containing protein [Chloroflexota bacterium]
MLVKDRMSKPPITVRENVGVEEALRLMHSEDVRRLPVVDKHGKMLGIVSELDLLKVSPSPATSLSVYEIPYLMAKIKMKDVMTKDVITVTEDTPLEEAARVMADNKIGGLPVMRDGKLVGIITETDLFKTFLEMLGGREEGVRISMFVPDEEGMLAKIAGRIAEMGLNITALSTIMGEDPSTYLMTIRVDQSADMEALVAAMEEMELEVEDSRFCKRPACA